MSGVEKLEYLTLGVMIGALAGLFRMADREADRNKRATEDFKSTPALTATYVDEKGRVGFDELLQGQHGDGKADYIAQVTPGKPFTTNELGKTMSGQDWMPKLRRGSIQYSR